MQEVRNWLVENPWRALVLVLLLLLAINRLASWLYPSN